MLSDRMRVLLLAIPFYLPAVLRVMPPGQANLAGLLSDVALGSLFLCVALLGSRWLQAVMLSLWVIFQVGAQEMLASVQRFPTWQDLRYLADPAFVSNTTAGLQLSSPLGVGLMLVALGVGILLNATRVRASRLLLGFVLAVSLFILQGLASRQAIDAPVAERFNAMHWFVRDAMSMQFRQTNAAAPLPAIFTRVDLKGARMIGGGSARNVLIVVMEGIPGLYHPDIRRAMGVTEDAPTMSALVAQTTTGMLVPDFVSHSHQTIRGLYALLCGDVSKLSMGTPKAIEIIANPVRAAQCLPAQLAEHGWSTHFLQGAGLAFMGKDRVMPAIGFQDVHGKEWFTEPDEILSVWGASDQAFFKGAREYIAGLKGQGKPWMLTLLTVGTHQPYAVPRGVARDYRSRMLASVAILDKAVGGFLQGLAADGVLDDTLVILTSDESHGSPVGDWVSSWGINIVLAPESDQLPRVKQGTFGLMDMEASILDYFSLPVPSAVAGRSVFRDYTTGRDIAAYTGDKLRWQTADNRRYECTRGEDCRVCDGAGLLGPRPDTCRWNERGHDRRLLAMAYALDHLLDAGDREREMRFASGEIHDLPERLQFELADTLAGAQYLSFPAESKVHVTIRMKAPQSNGGDVQMYLKLRAWEDNVDGIEDKLFPVLKAGEETALEFDFVTKQAVRSFSFHLVGEGVRSQIQLQEFSVKVTPADS